MFSSISKCLLILRFYLGQSIFSSFSSSSCPLVASNSAFALLADAGGNMCFALKNKKEKQKKKKRVPISRVGFILDQLLNSETFYFNSQRQFGCYFSVWLSVCICVCVCVCVCVCLLLLLTQSVNYTSILSDSALVAFCLSRVWSHTNAISGTGRKQAFLFNQGVTDQRGDVGLPR